MGKTLFNVDSWISDLPHIKALPDFEVRYRDNETALKLHYSNANLYNLYTSMIWESINFPFEENNKSNEFIIKYETEKTYFTGNVTIEYTPLKKYVKVANSTIITTSISHSIPINFQFNLRQPVAAADRFGFDAATTKDMFTKLVISPVKPFNLNFLTNNYQQNCTQAMRLDIGTFILDRIQTLDYIILDEVLQKEISQKLENARRSIIIIKFSLIMNRNLLIIFFTLSISTLILALEPEYNSRRQFYNQRCEENSFFQFCADGCPANCKNQKTDQNCKVACTSGCQCYPGYIFLSGSSGPCVPKDSCP
ncbi:hypothetical protein BLOT_012492 [Blomia tropicalis]|nr:hypothetical protein BLOT_012492 [Blomia tropicalis]